MFPNSLFNRDFLAEHVWKISSELKKTLKKNDSRKIKNWAHFQIAMVIILHRVASCIQLARTYMRQPYSHVTCNMHSRRICKGPKLNERLYRRVGVELCLDMILRSVVF